MNENSIGSPGLSRLTAVEKLPKSTNRPNHRIGDLFSSSALCRSNGNRRANVLFPALFFPTNKVIGLSSINAVSEKQRRLRKRTADKLLMYNLPWQIFYANKLNESYHDQSKSAAKAEETYLVKTFMPPDLCKSSGPHTVYTQKKGLCMKHKPLNSLSSQSESNTQPTDYELIICNSTYSGRKNNRNPASPSADFPPATSSPHPKPQLNHLLARRRRPPPISRRTGRTRMQDAAEFHR